MSDTRITDSEDFSRPQYKNGTFLDYVNMVVKLPLLGIMGDAGAGKDTVADYLVERHGYYRRAFADQLKEDVGHMTLGALYDSKKYPYEQYPLGQKDNALRWVNDHKSNPAVRSMLQSYGVYMRETVDKDWWVKAVFQHMENEFPSTLEVHQIPPLVIPDVRFPNEVEIVKAHSGIILKVVRPAYDNGLSEEQRSHISERALEAVVPDIVIVNNSTKEALHESVNIALSVHAVSPGKSASFSY